MDDAPFFATDNLDLALTRLAEGRSALYRGPHQGVFRFESAKIAALRVFLRALSEAGYAPVAGARPENAEDTLLREFFAAA